MTKRQKRFVEEYARLRNAAEAARRAGYSPFNAAVSGANLLRTKTVAAALRAAGVDVPLPPEALSFCRDNAGLTQRQRRFVEHYLITANASEAARRAGYSARSAKSAAAQLRRSSAIVAALEAAQTARADRMQLSADRVIAEVAKLSFVDLAAIFDWSDGALKLKSPQEIAPEDRAALAQITLSTGKSGTRVHVKLFDKLKALDLLFKHYGLNKPKPEKPAEEQVTIDGRDPRDVLRERLGRLARGAGQGTAKTDEAAPPPEASSQTKAS